MWVQVPSSARKTQVVRLESFCVIEKIAIDVESLVIEVMVLELSNGCMNAYFEENVTCNMERRKRGCYGHQRAALCPAFVGRAGERVMEI